MNEALLRLGSFALIVLLMLCVEMLWPRRTRQLDVLQRWPANFGAAMLGTVLIWLLVPATAVGVALAGDAHGLGLFRWLNLPDPLGVALTVLALDFAVYWQHRAMHYFPLLWRLHRMHHMDLEIDASTGVRFHPFELLVSLLFKLTVILAIGAPAAGVLLFEVLLNASSVFNHANVRIPGHADSLLRKLIVTPDMHRVHHSTIPAETNSNFGFFLSCWDHLFTSYTAQPALGHTGMAIGLKEYRDPSAARIDRMLANPFDQPDA